MSGVLAIRGLGFVTPVGLSYAASMAALRAGVPQLREFEGWMDGGALPDPPVVGGRVPLEWLHGTVEEDWPGHERWKLAIPRPHVLIPPGPERLVELAIPAAEEAWAMSGYSARSATGVGIYLGLDEMDAAEPIAEAIGKAIGLQFSVVRGDRLGRASGLAALHRAARHLAEGRIGVAVVGGVDSRLRRDALARMLEAGMVRIKDVPDGVLPGEAAGFAVLTASDGSRAMSYVDGSGVAEEPTTGTDDPNVGVGLTLALRRAREAAVRDMTDFPWVACDLEGRRYRVHEWVYAKARVLGDVLTREGGPAETAMWHAADCIGDTGAASGLVHLGWAVHALNEGYAGIDHSLVWGASDGILRAAVRVVRRDPARN